MLAHFCVFFLLKGKLVAREQGRFAQKASAQLFRIADFGFFWFSFSIHIPQSAFRNLEAGPPGTREFGIRNVEFGILCFFPHSAFRTLHSAFKMPALPKKRRVPHGFCAKRPCFRAGQCLKFNRAYARLEAVPGPGPRPWF